MNPKNNKKLNRTFLGFSISKERENFFENLGVMLTSGLDVSTILRSLKQEVRSKSLKNLIDDLADDIDNGSPIWKAIDRLGILPERLVAIVRSGEESGKLTQNLKMVLDQQQKDKSFKSKITSALIYPVFVLVVIVIIGGLLAMFILPQLANVYGNFKTDLPWITKFVIVIGKFFGEWGYIFVPSFLAIFLLIIYIVFFNPKTKFMGQAIMLRMPVFSAVIKETEITRLGYILSTLLEAGTPIQLALSSLEKSTTTIAYQKLYAHIRKSIEDGNSFRQSFDSYNGINRYIPLSTRQMIISGEETGNLTEILMKVSKTFEDKTEVTLKNLSIVIEPLLLVIVWVGVSAIAFATILPIYNLVGDVSNLSDQSTNPPPAPVTQTSTISNQSITTTPPVSNLIVIKDTPSGYVNARETYSEAAGIVFQVKSGEKYQYVEKQNGWYKINYKGLVGWIYESYAMETQ